MRVRLNQLKRQIIAATVVTKEGRKGILLAAHHKFSNLTCIVDYNHSTDRALNMGDMAAKFAAFGWRATTIDGHDHAAIEAALLARDPQKPTAVIAETIKGHGVKQMENNPAWHHRCPSREEMEAMFQELA